MKTTIMNWYLVDLMHLKDNSSKRLLRQILWGDVMTDETGRFSAGDYVCTNFIDTREGNYFVTRSGRHYKCVGEEQHVEVDILDLDILRKGVSPKQLAIIKVNIINEDSL
jgi:hypothetical protein